MVAYLERGGEMECGCGIVFAPFRNFWNQFSLRMSYGLVAKMNSEAINSLPVYDSRLTFRKDISDREYAIYIQHLENRDLTWEKCMSSMWEPTCLSGMTGSAVRWMCIRGVRSI